MSFAERNSANVVGVKNNIIAEASKSDFGTAFISPPYMFSHQRSRLGHSFRGPPNGSGAHPRTARMSRLRRAAGPVRGSSGAAPRWAAPDEASLKWLQRTRWHCHVRFFNDSRSRADVVLSLIVPKLSRYGWRFTTDRDYEISTWFWSWLRPDVRRCPNIKVIYDRFRCKCVAAERGARLDANLQGSIAVEVDCASVSGFGTAVSFPHARCAYPSFVPGRAHKKGHHGRCLSPQRARCQSGDHRKKSRSHISPSATIRTCRHNGLPFGRLSSPLLAPYGHSKSI